MYLRKCSASSTRLRASRPLRRGKISCGRAFGTGRAYRLTVRGTSSTTPLLLKEGTEKVADGFKGRRFAEDVRVLAGLAFAVHIDEPAETLDTEPEAETRAGENADLPSRAPRSASAASEATPESENEANALDGGAECVTVLENGASAAAPVRAGV